MMAPKKPMQKLARRVSAGAGTAADKAVHEATHGVRFDAERVEQALCWLRGTLRVGADLHTDSRAVQAGDGYLAYPVDGADNRAHIGDAIARGAAAVLVQPEGDSGSATSAFAPERTSAVPTLSVPGLAKLAGVIAGGWYGEPSKAMHMVAVTGTNGKTSSTQWIAHALSALGTPTALVGTLGVGFPDKLVPTGFTTPNAAQLQHALADLRLRGAGAVAMEVSSHALHQGRVNGTQFDVAVFTNLTQDHLDYHHTMAAYEAAKARLFDWPDLRFAVINEDDAAGRRLLSHLDGQLPTLAYSVAAEDDTGMTDAGEGRRAPATYRLRASDVHVVASGRTAFTVTLEDGDPDGATVLPSCFETQRSVLHFPSFRAAVEVPTVGTFNVANLLAVLGTLLAMRHFAVLGDLHDPRHTDPAQLAAHAMTAASFKAAVATLSALQPVSGRMQRIGGRAQADEPLVIIDYAHTPDALEKTLVALRPVAAARGGALVVVFGCGGDRDAAKRPLMGAIASRLADAVVLTSDNPRSENAADIIDQIAAGVPETEQADTVRRIEDRASAILQSIRTAKREDVVLLAGKGHEATQEIMGKKRPFSDQDHAQLALAARATQLRGEAS